MPDRVFTQPFVSVASLLERDGKILFAKQGQGQARGLWDLPAGWVDLGEDLLAAVIRETKEETGLTFTPTGIVGIYSYVKRSKIRLGGILQPVCCTFRGTYTGKVVCDGAEVLEHQWFTAEEIDAMDQTIIRSLNCKTMVKDFFEGRNFPLDLIHHEVDTVNFHCV